VRWFQISTQSRHSLRTVRTQRSAEAFARGACGGVFITSIPRVGEDDVECSGELRVAVTRQVPQRVGSLVQVDQQVPRLLGDPRAGGVRAHSDDVHPPGSDLDEEQHVDPH